MKKAKIITIITIVLTGIFFLFATPTIDLNMVGLNFKADGLDISTITKGKYSGEINFTDELDTRGGKKYNFNVDLKEDTNIFKDGDYTDLKEFSQSSINKFAERLSNIGFKNFNLHWYIDRDNILNLDLLLANHSQKVEEVVPLLAGKGDITFYSQDPEYIPDNNQKSNSFNFFEGIKKTEITRNDIDSFKSIYSSKVNGYGFKITFKKETKSKLLGYIQSETNKATMLFIDGQPVAVRSYQVENLFNSSGKKPVMYMASFFSDNLFINNAIETIYHTGPLGFDIKFKSKQSVTPLLGIDFIYNLKITLFVTFTSLSILLILKYKKFGFYLLFSNFIYGVFNLFLLKLFSASLSLPLILGQIISLIFWIIMNIHIFQNLQEIDIKNEKEINSFIKDRIILYRNLFVLFLGVIVVFAFIPVGEVSFLANGLGVGLIVGMVLEYLLMHGLFKLFIKYYK